MNHVAAVATVVVVATVATVVVVAIVDVDVVVVVVVASFPHDSRPFDFIVIALLSKNLLIARMFCLNRPTYSS